jgi:NADH-quinone oxidoreductase subunit A
MSQLIPVLVLGAFVLIFGVIIEIVAWLCGTAVKKGAGPAPMKLESYECGLPSDTSGSTRIPIKFYLTAILFILFDIEIIFMYPWALTYGDFLNGGLGLYIFGSMGFFLLVFIFGLFWEVKSKALEWE